MSETLADLLADDARGAVFSDDGEHRYCLWWIWDAAKPTLAFVMLNPSTADATELDPTCRRCKGYAEEWGYGTLLVGNIFALASTDPGRLSDHPDPVGPENDRYLRAICDEADTVVAAWGNYGDLYDRGSEVVELLDVELYALDTTRDGQPNHPLYQPGDTEPEPYGGDR